MEISELSLQELKASLEAKKLSSEEIVSHYLEKISQNNPILNAYITVNESALAESRRIDLQRLKGRPLGCLAGIPVGIKDMLCTEGIKTTAASKILANFVPPYSATVVDRLKAQGAIILGKLNCDEFAMGSSNEHSAFGPVRNPWNLDCVPGGSSGGSAAAVAGGLAPVTIGTDTGGSIRQPAAFCGIVGLKPTYGRVSRFGIIAFASSLDQAGPMSKTVEDSATILSVIAGHDARDMTSSVQPVLDWNAEMKEEIRGYKIGLVQEFRSNQVGTEIKNRMDAVVECLVSCGAEMVEVSIPAVQNSIPVYYLVAASEASSNLARYDGVRYGYRTEFSLSSEKDINSLYCDSRAEGFGDEVKRRIMIGTYALSAGYYDAFYAKACQLRRKLLIEFNAAFKKCDVLLSPVAATTAFKIGSRIHNPLEMYLNDLFTTSTNLAGLPAMSVPAGFSKDGLPVGVQLTAAHFQELKIFDVGLAVQRHLRYEQRKPHVC